jgi:hypothetical protein
MEGEGINIFQKSDGISYQGFGIYSNNTQTGISCATTLELDTIVALPTDAKIGYISQIIPSECSDGSYQEYILKIEDGEGSNANVNVFLNQYDKKGGSMLYSAKTIYTVDPNMKMSKVELFYNFVSDGNTADFHSISISQD